MPNGIDVSNNNGHVDWAEIAAAGYRYALAKATQGLGFVDSTYDANRAGARAHGIHFGAYHYFTPGDDPAAQVSFFMEHAKPAKGDIVPTLDYEQVPAERGPAEAFVVALQRECGHWPMFYSYLSFIQSMRIPAASPLAHCPLWLADYTTTRPAPPAPWHEIVIWQHSSTGRVAGIGGSVDLDAGTPPLDVDAHPIIGYDVLYYAKDGKTRHRVQKKSPVLYLAERPKVKTHGRIIIDPVHKK